MFWLFFYQPSKDYLNFIQKNLKVKKKLLLLLWFSNKNGVISLSTKKTTLSKFFLGITFLQLSA